MISYNDISRLDLFRELGQDFTQAVARQFRSISGHIVASRNDHISIDIVSKLPDTAHDCCSSPHLSRAPAGTDLLCAPRTTSGSTDTIMRSLRWVFII